MVPKGYPYNSVGVGRKKESPLIREIKYSFKNKYNLQYIVNVEQYQYDIFIVKFHLADHSNSKWRYCYLTKQGDARRIIFTCVEIGLEIYSKFPNASFGFIGNPTKKEIKIRKFDNTKRYKAYQNFAKFFFDPNVFEHIYNNEKSTYILLNRKKKEDTKDLLKSIIKMFETHYDIENIYSGLMYEPPKKKNQAKAK